MREKILRLEKISRQLEPAFEARKSVRDRVVDYSESFLKNIDTLNAYNITKEKGKGLLNSPISENGIGIEKALNLIKKNVDFPGLNPASGGHLGYIPGGGIYYSALADYLVDVTNRYAGVFFGGPGAVRMENMLIRWMSSVVGYPKTAAGNLSSGGSLGNLMGIVTARDAHKIKSKDFPKSVIYLSSQAHHSVDKAIRIAGLGECIIRKIDLDNGYRIRASSLEKQIKADLKKKLKPFLVIASAGTTDVGAIDPLPELGRITKRHKLWFHIDAAYGGFFILTKEGRKKLKGLELSDSLVIDPHKGLFLPYGLGVVLVKNPKHLHASHYYMANYMQDTVGDNEEQSPAELSPELTKHFRGMRLWLPLKLHGLKPFRACLDEKLMLTKYFYDEIQKLGFEVGPVPELSVATYRYIPQSSSLKTQNEFNKRLIEEVIKDGRVFISSTLLDGKFTMRFACLSFRTRLSTVDLLLKIINEKLSMLLREFKLSH